MALFHARTLALSLALGGLTVAGASAAWAQGEVLVFPPDGYQTTAEHIFFVGTAPAGEGVTLEGRRVLRSPAGHFAPTVPLAPGVNTLHLRWGAQTREVRVTRLPSEPPEPMGAAFRAGSFWPSADVQRLPGERVTFEAIGPANARVSVSWNGQSVPLLPRERQRELPPNLAGLIGQNLAYSPRHGTRYAGELVLTAPTRAEAPVFHLTLGGRSRDARGPGRLGVLAPTALAVVAVNVPEGVTRTGPGSDFSRRTPLPALTTDAVTGSEGDYLRLRYGGWIRAAETRGVPGALPPRTIVRSLEASRRADATDLTIPLQAAVPVDVAQGERTFELTLHAAVAQTDIIRHVDDPLVERISFAQVAPDAVRYTLHLRHARVGGYALRYDGTALVLSLRDLPAPTLAGRTVLLDPGHGGSEDPGTTGPTGRHEKDLTLETARIVRDELVRRGAHVLLTRDADVYVPLAERQAAVARVRPDLALSLHYNALPDGGDAEHTRGVGAFWYDPIASDLALCLHRALTHELERPSYGVFWDNLAVARPVSAPCVLLELGFLTHPQDFEWLTDAGNERREAVAIAHGIENWLRAGATP